MTFFGVTIVLLAALAFWLIMKSIGTLSERKREFYSGTALLICVVNLIIIAVHTL